MSSPAPNDSKKAGIGLSASVPSSVRIHHAPPDPGNIRAASLSYLAVGGGPCVPVRDFTTAGRVQ
jgi:hypothetical protein